MTKNKAIEAFLNPKSIAIVGVSKNFSSISGKPLKNLINHQYEGPLYPVNPKYDEISGLTCYPSLVDIPGEVDVALIAVSSKRMMQVLEDCKTKKIYNLVLFGSGFAEIGVNGERLQQEVLDKAQKYGISIIGPNCLGMLNVKKSIPLGFATQFETKEGFIKGNVGFASQSGALGFSLFGLAQQEHVGFSYIMNTGNQMDIHTLDCIEYMLEDDETEVVAGYLESIPDGNMLIELSKRAKNLKKPLILLKAGRSEIGSQAAMSHTASLTGSDETFQAIAQQYGLIIANDVDDMIDLMKVFSRGKLPKGNRIATLSNSGAAGIVMADYSEMLNLDLVRLSNETKQKIESIIPVYGSALNPIDITAQALKEQHIFNDTIDVLVNDDTIDAIVIHTTFGGPLGEEVCKNIAEIEKGTEKPIIVTVTGTEELTGAGRAILERANVPTYVTSYRTMVSLKELTKFSEYIQKQQVKKTERLKVETFNNVEESGVWTEELVKETLKKLGISIPQGTLIQNKRHLEDVKKKLNYPLVCKGISNDILHKSDAGIVKLGIQNSNELEHSYQEILDAFQSYDSGAEIKGILAEEMFQQDNVEMFIGIKEDPQFGSLIVCGLGGIFIEILKDVSIRRVPIQLEDAHDMVKSLKGYPILEGARGSKKHDIDALAKTLVKVSQYTEAKEGSISEMDINPLWVFEEGNGVAALDGIIVWKENTVAQKI